MEKEVIGDCTLYHADCTEVIPTLDVIGAVVTDPPYGMSFQSNHYKGKNGKPNASAHDRIKGDGDPAMLRIAYGIPSGHSSYIFCRWDNLIDLPDAPNSVIAWVKPNWSMGDLNHEHGRQYEMIAFYRGPDHEWPNKRPADVVRHARTGNSHHPTEKPVSLMKEVVSWTKGTVFDPFMGSGSTGVACADMGRTFIGCEVERKYFDVACERITATYAQGRLFA